MGKGTVSKEGSKKAFKPSIDPEARTNRLIALAYDNAEQRLMEGTASPQIIVHFLKLATERTKLENQKLENERELLAAKTEAVKGSKHVEELYANALEAMRRYSGQRGDDEDAPDIF